MTKNEYRAARRLIRDNGRYALRWLNGVQRAEMTGLVEQQRTADPLAERAELFESMGWGLHLSKSIARGIASQRGFA